MVDYIVQKVVKDVYILRLNDSSTKYFEALWEIPEGVTYNSFVVFTDDRVIVVDGWKKGYEQIYIEALREVVEPGNINYIIVNHSEPDHSGTIPTLAKVAKQSLILGHRIAIEILRSFYGLEANYRPVNDGELVKISDGETLVIHYVPWLHWPDTIVSYFVEKKALFSCDVFGSYGIPSRVFYEELGDDDKRLFNYYTKKYFVNIIGKYVDWVNRNLSKLSPLLNNIEIVAPSHGPIYKNVETPLSLYRYLGSKAIERRKTVIVYASMYGFTENIINTLIEEIEKKGIHPLVFRITDKNQPIYSELITELFDAENIVIGTPNYDSDIYPSIKYVAELMKAKIPPDNKRIVLLSSYGWGAVAARKLKDVLSEKGFRVMDMVEFKGRPTENTVDFLKRVVEKITQ